MKRKPTDCAEIQGWLYDWLSQRAPDPYDFPLGLIEDWADEEGVEGVADYTVDDLTEGQRSRYAAWLENQIPRLAYADPHGLPAYLTLHAERKPPPGSWFAHFTREPGGFREFDRGTTIEGMHLSTWSSHKSTANCKTNLSQDIGVYDVVFGFAVDLNTAIRQQPRYAQQYGPNVVVFQCDCAVIAYHDGDEDYQAIFPICSEYNVVPFYSTGGRSLLARAENDDDIEFDSLGDAVNYIDNAEPGAGLGRRGGGWPRLRRLVRR